TTMRLGPVTLGPGQSTIQAGYAAVPAPGSAATLTLTSLSRTAGGTVNFVGNSGGGAAAGLDTGFNRITFATVPALVGNNGGILPYATVGGSDFATYDGVNNSVAAFTGYAGSIAAAGPGDVVKLTGN